MCVYVHIYTSICTRLCIYIYTYVYVYVYVSLYMYVYTHLCLQIYTHILMGHGLKHASIAPLWLPHLPHGFWDGFGASKREVQAFHSTLRLFLY